VADPNSLLGIITTLLTSAIFGGASWILHRRLRNRQSARFFLSVIVLVAWLPVSSLITFFLLTYSNPDNPGQLVNWFLISSQSLVPSLLMLLVASTFWFAVRSIALQPNNSFKPNPLRGSA
jgi:drug/metabolite transporter (DMT)-like permease